MLSSELCHRSAKALCILWRVVTLSSLPHTSCLFICDIQQSLIVWNEKTLVQFAYIHMYMKPYVHKTMYIFTKADMHTCRHSYLCVCPFTNTFASNHMSIECDCHCYILIHGFLNDFSVPEIRSHRFLDLKRWTTSEPLRLVVLAMYFASIPTWARLERCPVMPGRSWLWPVLTGYVCCKML